jgi:DNA repair protein RadB
MGGRTFLPEESALRHQQNEGRFGVFEPYRFGGHKSRLTTRIGMTDAAKGVEVSAADLADEQALSTGSVLMDELIGGLEPGIISTAFGSAGSGKSTLCLQATVAAVRRGSTVIYVDTEGGFSVERLLQMADRSVLDHILVVRPRALASQKEVFAKIQEDSKGAGLIIVDSMSMLYRMELTSGPIPEAARELASHMALLLEIARDERIPVLVTSQVYSAMDGTDRSVMYGGEFMRYASKCLLEFSYNTDSGVRKVALRKHRSRPESAPRAFRITNAGIAS